MTIRQQIDGLVREMVDKGILYEDASREFEARFISVALEEEGGSIGRAAERIGMHRNTLSRRSTNTRSRSPSSWRRGSRALDPPEPAAQQVRLQRGRDRRRRVGALHARQRRVRRRRRVPPRRRRPPTPGPTRPP